MPTSGITERAAGIAPTSRVGRGAAAATGGAQAIIGVDLLIAISVMQKMNAKVMPESQGRMMKLFRQVKKWRLMQGCRVSLMYEWVCGWKQW